ncbi:hypothetical protein GKC30_03000 [Pseudodesulfovibrio sp. F-1]|uniref:Uncharacterized protein n=1 Tax=Pseudodesulfovibrio alkaliphilus TaxID=2661613 RepID=A0A7K1KKJ9_9BACT|nr:hypothetical protein [Pseudodesulfovibrio alkaliphilus]MUM76598.1 hypothetical protein [Pseudodesulfovibrio alkaliphilus]
MIGGRGAGRRLEVVLFGTFVSVCALHLSREAVKAAIKTYGSAKWNVIVRDMALGRDARRKMAEVAHTLGHPVREVYRAQGVAMHDNRFGLEVFHGGEPVPLSMLAAKNRTLHPQRLMEDYKLKDMLAVFWARREGAMHFRWDEADFRDQAEVALAYDSLAPLLARRHAFDLALDVVWRDSRGKRRLPGGGKGAAPLEHVFHVAG